MKVFVAAFFISLIAGAAAISYIPLKNLYASPEAQKYRFNQIRKVLDGILKNRAVTNKKVFATAQEVLNNYLDVQWYGPVTIGSQQKTFQVLFDTGSSDFWLMGSNCWSLACFVHSTFASSSSTTFKSLGKTFSITYGSGSTSGNIGTDTFTVAGLTCKDCYVGVATTVSSDFYSSEFDGIAGMGWPALSAMNGTPFFFDLVNQGQTDEPVFCFYLSKDSGASGSTLILGGVDMSFTTASQLSYVPLTSETYWLIQIDGIGVNGQSSGSIGAIVDSGTSLLVGDTSVIQPILDAIGSNYSCDSPSSSPDVEVTIGGQKYTIPPSIYLLNVQGECQLGIQATDLPSQLGFSVILGDVFMRQYYTCFDGGNKRLGFGLAK